MPTEPLRNSVKGNERSKRERIRPPRGSPLGVPLGPSRVGKGQDPNGAVAPRPPSHRPCCPPPQGPIVDLLSKEARVNEKYEYYRSKSRSVTFKA